MNIDIDIEHYAPEGEELLPFQKAGVLEIILRKNVLLADEMGLGKTIQILSYINVKTPARILIVCPNSIRLNWLNEANKWLKPQIREQYDIEFCTPSLYIPLSNFVIASYEGLTKWAPILHKQEWDLVVLDEAHFVKTPNAKRSRAARDLNGFKKIYATGTPIVNYPHELFPLIHDLDKETWPEFYTFASKHLDRTHKFGRHLAQLQETLRSTIMIRRLKKEVLPELPRKRRQIIELPAEGRLLELVQKEKELWQTQETLVREIEEALGLREAGSADTDTDFESLIESMKATKRYFFDEISIIRHELARAKVPYVCEHLESVLENRDKVVVFVHHHDVARAIHEHFKENSVLVFGPVSVDHREERKQRFWEDSNCNLYIGSLKVSGYGINLQIAHHVVFAELDWSPGTLTQAEDRCHRIGQEKSLLVQHLVAQDSMDSFMAKKVINKQKSIRTAVDRRGE